MHALTVSPIADLSPHMNGHEIVAFNAGHDGLVYIALQKPPFEHRAELAGGAGFAVTQPRCLQSYRLVSLRGSTVELDVTIENERFNIHFLQPIGDELLLTCSRSHYSSSGNHEQNGRIYSRGGELVGEVLLGDGIQDLQTTANGVIWASYFDEGVFGNFAWPEPLGASGLVAWDRKGRTLVEFEPTQGLDDICDCYAMNVATDDDVWACYYMDFPLVHIRGGQVQKHWRAPTTGSAAFAVGAGHCLFQGGYRERDSYFLAELGARKDPRLVKRFVLQDEMGRTVEASRTTARGERIYLVEGHTVYLLDIAASFAAG